MKKLLLVCIFILTIINVGFALPSVPKGRELYFIGTVNDESIYPFIAKLRTLDSTRGSIRIYISSPGGSVDAGMALCNTMLTSKNIIQVVVMNYVGSMGSIITACGTKGYRAMYSDSTFFIHFGAVGLDGIYNRKDLMTIYNSLLQTDIKLANLLVSRSTLSLPEVCKLCDAETELSSVQALDYGFIDEILVPKGEK